MYIYTSGTRAQDHTQHIKIINMNIKIHIDINMNIDITPPTPPHAPPGPSADGPSMGWWGGGWGGIPYGYISILDIGYWVYILSSRSSDKYRNIVLIFDMHHLLDMLS